MTIKLHSVSPIGTTTSRAFVYGDSGCELRDVDMPVYPASPEGEAFRVARVAAGLSIRDVSRRLGLSAVDLSAVERGAKVADDWGEWWERSGIRP